jgi:hypothetical protein
MHTLRPLACIIALGLSVGFALGAFANVVLHQPMPIRLDGLTNPRIGVT